MPESYRGRQRQLDYMRLALQGLLVGSLFFQLSRPVGFALLASIVLAAILNAARSSREHSGYANHGAVSEFNEYHSSNTAGRGLLNRLLWFPVPYHALHHTAPRVPFFMLGNLHQRIQKRLSASREREELFQLNGPWLSREHRQVSSVRSAMYVWVSALSSVSS